MMKHLILLMAFLYSSCATQNRQPQQDGSLTALIRSGQNVYFENQAFDEAVDFTAFLPENLISPGVYQSAVPSSITFKGCTFKKPVTAYRQEQGGKVVFARFAGNVSFIECQFQDEVNFRGSSILGPADFTGSFFAKGASFEEASFHQNAYFKGCNFQGGLRFQNSFFIQKANFMEAQFNGTANFQQTVFNAELQWSLAKFYGYAELSLIDCRSNAFFNYAEFRGRADFSNSTFSRNLDCIGTYHERTAFDNCRFMGEVKFFKSTVENALSFQDCFFLFGAPQLDFLPEDKVVVRARK